MSIFNPLSSEHNAWKDLNQYTSKQTGMKRVGAGLAGAGITVASALVGMMTFGVGAAPVFRLMVKSLVKPEKNTVAQQKTDTIRGKALPTTNGQKQAAKGDQVQGNQNQKKLGGNRTPNAGAPPQIGKPVGQQGMQANRQGDQARAPRGQGQAQQRGAQPRGQHRNDGQLPDWRAKPDPQHGTVYNGPSPASPNFQGQGQPAPTPQGQPQPQQQGMPFLPQQPHSQQPGFQQQPTPAAAGMAPTKVASSPVGANPASAGVAQAPVVSLQTVLASTKENNSLSQNPVMADLINSAKGFWNLKGIDKDRPVHDYINHGLTEPHDKANWITTIFGESEAQIVDKLAKEIKEGRLPPPPVYTLSTIQSAFSQYPKSGDPAQIRDIQNRDVRYLHFDQGANHDIAVLQVASQEDYHESKIPGRPSFVTQYTQDYTQGPMASLEGLIATLYRKAATKAGVMNGALENVMPEEFKGRPGLLEHGWLNLEVLSDEEGKRLLAHMKQNIDKLQVLVQPVICERTGEMQMQVFNFAPSFQEKPTPTTFSWKDQICNLLIEKQYTAMVELAAVRSEQLNKTVPVHLTLVGLGSFNNNPRVIGFAWRAVEAAAAGRNVQVNWEVYAPMDALKLVCGILDATVGSEVTKDGQINADIMSRREDAMIELFKKHPDLVGRIGQTSFDVINNTGGIPVDTKQHLYNTGVVFSNCVQRGWK